MPDHEPTCIELVDVANPIQAGLWEIIQCYLQGMRFRADTHVKKRYQIIVSRYAMHTPYAHLMQPAKEILGNIDRALQFLCSYIVCH